MAFPGGDVFVDGTPFFPRRNGWESLTGDVLFPNREVSFIVRDMLFPGEEVLACGNLFFLSG